ncbi:MAG TPA: hypothetical protein VF068_12395 [Rubrobacter sp.]
MGGSVRQERAQEYEGRGYMVSRGATWSMETGLRWFVRVAAVSIALANLVGVVLWLFGGLRALGGEGAASSREALPSVLVAVIAGLAASQWVLWVFDLPGRGFWHRYRVVVESVSVGGVMEGVLLGWVFSLDGTLFPEPPPGFYTEHPLGLLLDLAWALLAGGFGGATIGLALGLAEGLVLGAPLAAVLGRYETTSPGR